MQNTLFEIIFIHFLFSILKIVNGQRDMNLPENDAWEEITIIFYC